MLRARDGSVLGRGGRYVAAALGPGRATRLIDSGGQLLLSCWMVTALAPCQSLGTGGRRTGSSRTAVALEGPVRPLRVRTSDPRARAPGSGRRRQLGGALPASGPGGQTPVLGTHVKPHSSVRGVHCLSHRGRGASPAGGVGELEPSLCLHWTVASAGPAAPGLERNQGGSWSHTPQRLSL